MLACSYSSFGDSYLPTCLFVKSVYGMQEIRLNIRDSEDVGVVICGGAGSQCGNPYDVTDEGIFISEVSSPR